MTSYNLSACTFIKNAFGGFCLFESMASWLPFVDEFVVLELGSTDGTCEVLQRIAESNPKVKVHAGQFPTVDASAFADVMNQAISLCAHDRVIAYQADEIPHQGLLRLAVEAFGRGDFDLSFWRYQLKDNFQTMKWPPHPIHRVGTKGNFTFVDDGMNTARTWDAHICSTYDGGNFLTWGDRYKDDYTRLPTHEMVLDVGKSGGFRDLIVDRARAHAPFWHNAPNVDGVGVEDWWSQEQRNEVWTRPTTPFDIPAIMRFHVGKTRYYLRDSLYQALQHDTTIDLLGMVKR